MTGAGALTGTWPLVGGHEDDTKEGEEDLLHCHVDSSFLVAGESVE